MLNVRTLFSGYDSQALALNRLGIPYDLAAWCEIDRHAITAHNALFPQWKDRNLGDVSRVDWAEWHTRHPQPIDLLTYSSPCQDFSLAGLQRGGEEGSGTRSGLLWETERAVRELRPRHLVFENVGGLVSDKFIDLFNRWQTRLNGYGYTNFQQLMNAKDYGVPQNRLRIFMVSILDCPCPYYFPKPFPLTRRLKDVLEQNVDERYYLSDERVAKLMQENAIHSDRGNGFAFRPHTPEEIASTVKCSGIGDKTDNFVAEPQCIQVAQIYDKEVNPQEGRIYSSEGLSPTIKSNHDITKIAEPQINTLGQLSSSQNSRIIGTEGISPAVINGEKDGMPKIVEPTIAGLPHGHYEGDLYTDYAPTVKSSAYAANNPLIEPCISSIRGRAEGEWYGSEHQQRLEIGGSDTSNSLTSVAKDNLLIVPQATKEGYAVVPEGGVFDASYPDSKTRRGRVQEGGSVSPTIMASQNELLRYEGIRIRRLTERELYRLMDVSEPDIDTLLAAPIPRTQHAKLAGNSIVVACLYHIFHNLFIDTEPEAGTQTKLF